jgi:hypothetical protein
MQGRLNREDVFHTSCMLAYKNLVNGVINQKSLFPTSLNVP